MAVNSFKTLVIDFPIDRLSRGQFHKTFFWFVIYRFLYYARVFVRLDYKKLPRDKHTSLVQILVNYG